MTRKEHNESRRWFIEQVGGAAAAMIAGPLLTGSGRLLAQDPCAPPGNTSSVVPWARDCRPIRPRRPASTLTAAEVTKLKDAYKAMRDLQTSDPSDPRGFQHQANVHCWNCGHSVQVHFNWNFFAWHRAYLYFHERILGKLIGDEDFRLPYWDWDVASHRKLPSAYTNPNNNTNPLWNGTRGMSPTDEVDEDGVGEDVMDNIMSLGTFAEFGGTASSSGDPEGAPHGSVHVDVGGDMGFFDSAAKDPVFYAHHANVDKIWSDWNKADSTHTNPTDAAFLNLTYTFFDENKTWRSIKASQLLDHEARLRYIYGPSKFWERLPCLLSVVIIDTRWATLKSLSLTDASRNQLAKAVESKVPIRMNLQALQVPTDRSAVYRVYLSEAEAKEDRGSASPGYLGAVPVVLNDRENRHKTLPYRNAVLNLTKRASQLLQRKEIRLFLAERTKGTSAKRVLPVAARNVTLSVANVGRQS